MVCTIEDSRGFSGERCDLFCSRGGGGGGGGGGGAFTCFVLSRSGKGMEKERKVIYMAV